MVTKLDPSGNQIWRREFGTPTWFDDAKDVALDTLGNIYVIGRTTNLVVDSQPGAHVRKYDSNGNVIWQRQFGEGDGNGSAYDIVISSNNEIYIGGITGGILNNITLARERSAYIRKLDTNGNVIWDNQFAKAAGVQVSNLAMDEQGAIYIVGSAGYLPGQTPAGNGDIFIRKYDPDTNVVWTREFGSTVTDYP